MNAQEVVTLLQAKLPALTDLFSDSVSVSSISSSGTTATAQATAHGKSTGDLVLIKGAQSDIQIATMTRNGIVGTLETLSDHDITNGLETITISGAVEPAYNGAHAILNVDSRRVIRFTMADSGPLTATGAMLLVDGESLLRGYNGLQVITAVPSVNSFQYETSGADLLPATGTIFADSGIRISASATFERILDAYTKQEPDDAWMFVVLGDVGASKNRVISNDAVDALSRNQQGKDFRQQIVQPITLFVFLPTSDQRAGREARDVAEDLFQKVCQSILFYSFDSGLTENNTAALTFVQHGLQAYNSAFYVHQYTFEQVVDITFNDTVGHDVDVAFRDISLIMKQSTGNESFTAEINLDDDS